MEQIPDAPWIRDAELNGYPSDPPVECPCCGEECNTIYADQYGNVFACEHTVVGDAGVSDPRGEHQHRADVVARKQFFIVGVFRGAVTV